jgi:hypothetical protein
MNVAPSVLPEETIERRVDTFVSAAFTIFAGDGVPKVSLHRFGNSPS